MKLKSFGCSFIFGTDLHDDGKDGTWATPSKFSWPALLAQHLGHDYQCFARPGSGNLQILERLSNQLAMQDPAFYVIGWTWTDRFDYIKSDADPWPGGGARWSTVMPIDEDPTARTYYKHLHSEHRDKLMSLICIKSAIDLLKSADQPFIMTYMDDIILDQRWNCSPGMIDMQEYIRPYLSQFEGMNFLEYSKKHGYPISRTAHPLEDAHQAAAQVVIDNFSIYLKGEYNE